MPVALAAFAETGRWLGIGLAGVINVLNPDAGRARRTTGRELSVRPLEPSRPSSTGASLRASRRLVRVVPDQPRR